MTQRSTKIIATLGPSSSDAKMIGTLAAAGANLFRLNFSHGSHEDHAERVKLIRQVETEIGRPIGIIADLQGPKYRIGEIGDPLDVKSGDNITFVRPEDDIAGDDTVIPLPHQDVFDAIMPGANILMDDGKLRMKVVRVGSNQIEAQLLNSGRISSRKGVNLPDTALNINALTDKDISDLDFALSRGVDFIALSFVQRAGDVIDAKARIGKSAQIISKIEKPQALTEIDAIISASDAVMIARGDLGVELPAEQVPSIQKQLVAKCRRVGKPVIVATQMLESMISAPTPTRAEASDVAGAVFDGADTVMLSAETAAGEYPEEAVQFMASIAHAAEQHIRENPHDGPAQMEVEPSIYHAVAEAAVRLADSIDACAIIAFTASGNTAVRLARERPRQPLLVLSPSVAVERSLSVLWGCQTSSQSETDYEQAVQEAVAQTKKRGLGGVGDSIVLVSGMPFGLSGTTNALRVVTL